MANDKEGSLVIVTLLLTGRATPYIYNGVVNVGDEKTYASPQYGVLKRCVIGLLMWESNTAKCDLFMLQPGSRLKTPNFPIWITNYTGHYGVMFNSNSELLCNYHAESCFKMIYYNSSGSDLTMTIDNPLYNEQTVCILERQISVMEGHTLLNASDLRFSSKEEISSIKDKNDAVTITPLLKLIHTKWEEAFVICQSQPYSMSYLFTPLDVENDSQ